MKQHYCSVYDSHNEGIPKFLWQDEPFVMYKKDCGDLPCTGNNRYEGFLIDLIEEIAIQLKFSGRYELYESPDGNYGSKGDNEEWNGMIRELIVGVSVQILPTVSHSQWAIISPAGFLPGSSRDC